MNEQHQSNRRYWDGLADRWEALRDQDGLWRQCPARPELAFEGEALAFIRKYLANPAGDLRGRRALVIGSGDNYAAFALAGLGAEVTSSDISERQLAVARQRAEALELDIGFVPSDAAGLDGLPDAAFDLVCSTNGFFVWIAEPGKVFQAARRVLKPGGFYIFYDIHPFQRPWKDQGAPLAMDRPYTDTGPFVETEDGRSTYEFHWRLSDLLNPLLDAGLALRQVAESPPKDPRFWEGHAYTPGSDPALLDWRANPRGGLPVWLTVAAQQPE